MGGRFSFSCVKSRSDSPIEDDSPDHSDGGFLDRPKNLPVCLRLQDEMARKNAEIPQLGPMMSIDQHAEVLTAPPIPPRVRSFPTREVHSIKVFVNKGTQTSVEEGAKVAIDYLPGAITSF